MTEFLDTYVGQNWNQQDISNQNKYIVGNKIELVIKCLLIKQNWRLDGFTAKLHQHCNKN